MAPTELENDQHLIEFATDAVIRIKTRVCESNGRRSRGKGVSYVRIMILRQKYDFNYSDLFLISTTGSL